MPAPSEDAISAPPATIDLDRQAAPARQEPSFAEPGPSKLPPSIASAFAAAAYALQHGDDAPVAGERRDPGAGTNTGSGLGTGLMPGLYASMVGETSRDYYLRLFERFDALGKALPTWNLAAGLFTLPWCALRGLWREGRLYALATASTGLLWGLLLRPALGLPPAIAHGMDATLALLAIAIPGLGANALYWRHVRRQTLQAIGEAPTMAQAHERLARHAATPARQRLATVAGLVLAAAAGAGAWALADPIHFTTASASSAATPPGPAAASTPAVEPAPAAVTPPAEPPVAEPAIPPTPAQTQQDPPAQAQPRPRPDPQPQPPSPAPGTAVSGMVEPMPAIATAGAGAVAVAAAPAKAAQVPVKPPAPAHVPVPAPAPAPAKPNRVAESRQDKPAEPAAKAAPAKPASSALEAGSYYINIGVFSDAGNAARVVERLEKARLPALSQTLHSNKGEIVRVRSGPFAKERSADQAAGRIRAMGLEATVFHHTPQEGKSARR